MKIIVKMLSLIFCGINLESLPRLWQYAGVERKVPIYCGIIRLGCVFEQSPLLRLLFSVKFAGIACR